MNKGLKLVLFLSSITYVVLINIGTLFAATCCYSTYPPKTPYCLTDRCFSSMYSCPDYAHYSGLYTGHIYVPGGESREIENSMSLNLHYSNIYYENTGIINRAANLTFHVNISMIDDPVKYYYHNAVLSGYLGGDGNNLSADGVVNFNFNDSVLNYGSFEDDCILDGYINAAINGSSIVASGSFRTALYVISFNFTGTALQPVLPYVDFLPMESIDTNVGSNINLDATPSFDLDGEITRYIWDFGDGNTGEGKTINYAFTKGGYYWITLTVIDNEGNESNTDRFVSVTPVSAFEYDPETPSVGEEITFDSWGSYDDFAGEIVSYIWDFGDDNSAEGEIVAHVYSNPGEYTVTLTVTDNEGFRDSTSKVIDIKPLTVLLVYGWHGTKENWVLLEDWLKKEGYIVEILDYDDSLPADISAETLSKKIEKMLDPNNDGQYDKINIIAHSFGGLVSRYYIEKMGGNNKVGRLIMIATPNHGTRLADYLVNQSLISEKEMTLLEGAMGFIRDIKAEDGDWGSTKDLKTVSNDWPPLINNNPFLAELNENLTQISGTLFDTTRYYVIAGYGHYPSWPKIINLIPPITSYKKFLKGHDDGVVALTSASLEENGVPLYCADLDHSSIVNPYRVKERSIEEQEMREDRLRDLYLFVIKPILNSSIPVGFECPNTPDPDDDKLIPNVFDHVVVKTYTGYETNSTFNVSNETKITIGFKFKFGPPYQPNLLNLNNIFLNSSVNIVLSLTSPTGELITSEVVNEDPNIVFYTDDNSLFYTIRNPESGEWRYALTALEVPLEGADIEFYAIGYYDESDEPTLINLSFFKAIPILGEIILNWASESEIDNAGFNLYRAETENGEYKKINSSLIPAEGLSTQGASYEFVDKGVKNGKTYYYKLEDIDLNGKSTMHGPVSATPRWLFGIFGK